MLTVLHQDALTDSADAIILPIDGTFVPAADQYDRLLGNVARQFQRAFPNVDLLEHIEAQLDLPLPLGRAVGIELEGGRFPTAILVSTLHHAEHLDQNAKRAVARESFSAALRVARQVHAKSVATPILQGGWRLPPLIAFSTMLESRELEDTRDIHVRIFVTDRQLATECQDLARSLGFDAAADRDS